MNNRINLFRTNFSYTTFFLAGNGLPSSSREVGPNLVPSSADWSRPHHRTPPTFHSPWPKPEEREKELERERERSMERRREEERER